MEDQFTPISDEQGYAELVERSRQEPVLVFKHDPVCSISIRAYHELKNLEGEIPMIDVKRAGPISQSVAAQTGVKHESPQVIVLRNGEAVWSASHYKIKADAVQRAVSDNT
jgi:bacillithiol system protein YtxJ